VNSVPFLSLKDATAELRGELDHAIERVLSSGHYIGGLEVEAFEAEFAAYVGAKHCIGVGNGLDAITMSLLAHGVPRGAKALVPSNTFIATWLGASHAGVVPVPVEPDWSTHLLDVAAVERALTPEVRAVLPVHLYGLPVDVPSLRRVCDSRGVVVVEDAAQAHGATVDGHRVGSFGTATWSFYPGKNLGALGDAGAVTTNDAEVAERLRRLRNYGSQVKYEHEAVGYNSRLDPMQAAVLRVKLRHLDAWNARRARIAALYLERLAGLEGLTLPTVPTGRTHVWHLFVVRTARRDALRAHLEQAGIGTLIHYPKPSHLQGAYVGAYGHERERLRETALAAEQVLSLPIGPHLSLDDAGRVAESVRSFFGAQ
jgi:dTDP-3-amino-3,4,6-trideoxy-alpha-D-glucose transaminase